MAIVASQVFRLGEGTPSRKQKIFEREVLKLKAAGKPYEHLLQALKRARYGTFRWALQPHTCHNRPIMAKNSSNLSYNAPIVASSNSSCSGLRVRLDAYSTTITTSIFFPIYKMCLRVL